MEREQPAQSGQNNTPVRERKVVRRSEAPKGDRAGQEKVSGDEDFRGSLQQGAHVGFVRRI